jgi:hypothetical protein
MKNQNLPPDASTHVYPPGTLFAQMCHVLAKAGSAGLPAAADIGAHVFGPNSRVALALKGAADAGSLSNSTWGSDLGPFRAISADFIAAVNERSILGLLPTTPANVEIPVYDHNAPLDGAWPGENGPAPVVEGALTSSAQLRPMRASCIVPITSELVKMGSPRAIALVRGLLIEAGRKMVESALLDPTNAGEANVKPAALSYGASAVTASGSFATDVAAMSEAYTGSWPDAVLITDDRTLMKISLLNIPNLRISPEGASLGQLRIAVSTGSPFEVGSPAGGTLTLIDRSAIRVAEEAAELDTSTIASLQMSTIPAAGAQPLRSIWQQGLVAFKITRWLDWNVPAAGRVVVCRGVAY